MSESRSIHIILSIAILLCFIGAIVSVGDTIIKKDGERLKGVVVEDYRDRIVLSTMDGEKEVMKSGIKNIAYDLEEQNLTNMAEMYQDRGMYKTAHYYYGEALKINPEYKKAREGLNYTAGLAQQTSRRRKLDHISRMNEEKVFRMGGPVDEEPSEKERLKKTLGIELDDVEGYYKIASVIPNSAAARGGLEKGDMIIAAWGRTISYMQPGEVMKKLLNVESVEVRLTIERTVTMDLANLKGNYPGVIGVQFEFSEMEGLIIKDVTDKSPADEAGIRKDDQLMEVEGESTRYMALGEVESIIKSRRKKTLSLKIKRDIVIWKKFA